MKRVVSLFVSGLIFIGVQAQTLSAPPLVSPSNGATVQDINVLLDWKPSLGATVSGYDVEVDDDTLFINPQMATINGTSGRPFELRFGKVYYWRVRGLSSTGNSSYSDYRSFTTFENQFTGLTPQGLNKSPRQSIEWDTIPGVLAYQYQLSNDTNLLNPSTGIVLHPDSNELFPQLEFGQTYYWRLRTMHGKDTSLWSNTVNFSIRNVIALKNPSDGQGELDPKSGLACANTAGVSEYVFQVDIDSLFNPNSIDLVTTTVLDKDFGSKDDIVYNTSRLRFGTNYYWRVQGVNNLGKSAWSGHRSITSIDKATLSFPADGETINVVSKLEWEMVDGAGGYTIEIDIDSIFPNPIHENLINDTSTSFLLVLNNYITESYYWRVKVWHSRDTANWSDISSFKVHPVGLVEQSLIEDISVYPNPAKSYIQVGFPETFEGNVTLTLFSITGKQIKVIDIADLQKETKKLTLDVSDFEKGVYLLRFDSNGMTSTKKIIVQ